MAVHRNEAARKSQVSGLIDTWLRKRAVSRRSIPRESYNKSSRDGGNGKGSINSLIENSKVASKARCITRKKTHTAPMATNLLMGFDASSQNSSAAVKSSLCLSSTKIRIMRETSSDKCWLRVKIKQNCNLNDKLTLLKTDHTKFSTIILQGLCSSNASYVQCNHDFLFQLYGNVFWCLNWKLS